MKNISVADLKTKIDKPHVILVDVRTIEERTEFNIGGLHIPLPQIQNMQIDELDNYKNNEVVCYCRAGHRSAIAAVILESMGFNNVQSLQGGMDAWKKL